MIHPGKNPSPKDYARLRRDLDILCGYEFDCENAFWDPVSRAYGTMRSWHLFTGWFEPHKRGADERQEELPFTFIEVSDIFRRVAEKRGFFVTGFDLEFFNSLKPTEQTLALYLSKVFISQDVHRRYEEMIFGALPIEGSTPRRSRQTLRDAAQGLLDKGYPYLASFKIERGRAGRYVATFFRKARIVQDYPETTLAPEDFPPDWREVLDEILRLTNDAGSLRMWANSIKQLGLESVRYAVADLRSEMQIGQNPIVKPGAWLNTKLLKMAEEKGVQLKRHKGDRTARKHR
jgi:hypothetical protein